MSDPLAFVNRLMQVQVEAARLNEEFEAKLRARRRARQAEEAEPASDAARAAGCTCRVVPPCKWGDDPEPTVRADEWCPLHGRDPDAALQAQRDGL